MGSVIRVAGARFTSKDGDVVEGIAYAVTRGFEDKKRNGDNVVVYRDINTMLTAVRTVDNFFSIYTLCSHPNLDVRGSFVVCPTCRMNFGVD